MSTQTSPVTPVIPPPLEPYVDSKRAALFLALAWKKVQKLSREGKIPAHPVLSGTPQPPQNLAVQAQRT